MKSNLVQNILCLVCLGATSMASAQDIKITEFLQGDSIAGVVKQMSADELKNMKVLVYVETDKLYIHPFINGGDHEAFSNVDSNGNWWVKSEHRSPAPTRIYAFLVSGDYPAPATADSFREIRFFSYDYAPYSEEAIKKRNR